MFMLNELGQMIGRVMQCDTGQKSNHRNSYYNDTINYHLCCIKQKNCDM